MGLYIHCVTLTTDKSVKCMFSLNVELKHPKQTIFFTSIYYKYVNENIYLAIKPFSTTLHVYQVRDETEFVIHVCILPHIKITRRYVPYCDLLLDYDVN